MSDSAYIDTKGDSTDSDFIASGTSLMRVLNVAEKNDAARTIAELLSRGSYRRVRCLSLTPTCCHAIEFVGIFIFMYHF